MKFILFFTGLYNVNSLFESIKLKTKLAIFWKYEGETLCCLFKNYVFALAKFFRIGLVSPSIHLLSYITNHIHLFVSLFS